MTTVGQQAPPDARQAGPGTHPAPRPGRLRAFARAKVGGLPGPFWVLWSGTLINRIGYMVEPFLAFYLTGVRGLPLATTGVILAMSGAGSIVSQLVSGSLSDRFGRRAVLTIGMLSNAAALLFLGYARGLASLVLATLIFGFTIDMYRPASSALVADLVCPAERPRAYGLLFWAVNLGFSVAMVLGGTLARSGFMWLFWADAGTCAVVGLMAWRGLPETRPGHPPRPRQRWRPAPATPAPAMPIAATPAAAPSAAAARLAAEPATVPSAAAQVAAKPAAAQVAAGLAPTARAGAGGAFLGRARTPRGWTRDPLMIGYLALSLGYCFVYLQAYTTLPLAMHLQGLSPQEYGLAMAVNGVLIVALQPLASGWLGRRDHCRVLAAGFVVVSLGFGLTALAGSVLGYAATVMVWTLGEIVTAGLAAAIVADLAPPAMRGRYSGAFGAIWSAAYLLGPLGGTRLLAMGAAVLWLTCGLIGTAAAVGLLALRPAIRRRSQIAAMPGN